MRAKNVSGRVGADIAVQLVRRVLVEPVRVGRLRSTGWPVGLAPIIVIGLGVYVLGLLGAVLTGPLRSWLPHDSESGFPPSLFGFMIIMITVVVALVCTGALHAPWPLRMVGLLLPLVVLIGVSAWTLTTWSVLVQLGAWVLLAGFAVWRWRRSFAWWEYVVVQTVVAAAMAVATWQGVRPALDREYLDATGLAVLLLGSVALFAVPTAVIAGVSLSELAFSTSVWLVETVSVRVRPVVTAVLTAGLLVVASAATGWQWSQAALPVLPHLLTTAVTAAVLLVTWVAWRIVDRLADRRGADSTRLHQVVPQARRVSVAMAVMISLPLMLAAMVLTLQLGLRLPAQELGLPVLPNGVIGFPEVSNAVLRGAGSLLAAVVALAVAGVAAVRNGRGAAELIMIIAVLSAVRGCAQLGWLPVTPSLDDLSLLGVVVIILLAVSWAVRRSLSERRVESVAVALLIALAVGQRELLADPLGLVLGGTGGALLAFGLVWTLLTGAEEANADSERFPRSARAILVVANLAVAMTAFAFGRLVVDETIDLGVFVGEGADVIGTGLLLAGLWAALGAGIRDEEVVEPVAELETNS